MTSKSPVPRKLRCDLYSFPCLHTAAAPTRPSSERVPSVHHIQTRTPTLGTFCLAQRCAALLAVVVSSSMVVLTTDSSPGGGQSMPLVVWPCSCSTQITLHISAPEEVLWCSSFSLLLHAFASLTVNRCCQAFKITGAGVSRHSLINAPWRVVGSVPRMDLVCRLRWSWRSSRLPSSLGSHQSLLPYSATA